ncbi:MAG TPA: hypothetical protein VFK32_02035 [Tepidiformaceae bacterium]|nr:hypothetical protein [Tepidiformaceae bacterium]
MSDASVCPDCGTTYESTDNYCRGCGMFLAALRQIEPVKVSTAAVVERPSAGLPAPVKKMVTAVAVGTALQIGVGLAGKYLAGQAVKQAAGVAVSRGGGRKAKVARPSKVVETRPAEVAETEESFFGGAAAIAETLIIRRVWIRK